MLPVSSVMMCSFNSNTYCCYQQELFISISFTFQQQALGCTVYCMSKSRTLPKNLRASTCSQSPLKCGLGLLVAPSPCDYEKERVYQEDTQHTGVPLGVYSVYSTCLAVPLRVDDTVACPRDYF